MSKTNAAMKAKLDELTGLRGRDAFGERLDSIVANGTVVSVALFDVDHFLSVNQNEGMEVGDRVLKRITETTQSNLPTPDSEVFRIGGDEFAAIMEDVEKERAFLAFEKVRNLIGMSDPLSATTPAPTVSIGVATYPDDAATRQEVMRKADDALYRAKSGQKNTVVLAREERKIPKTNHYTQGQLERLTSTSSKLGIGEAELLREALDDLLKKYSS